MLVAVIATGQDDRLWMLLGSPLLIACLLLSYRRSFWIASVLGVLLVLLLGDLAGRTAPAGARRRCGRGRDLAARLDPLPVQPATRQAGQLALRFSKLEANAEDRYRLDERANVLSRDRAAPDNGSGGRRAVAGDRRSAVRRTRRRPPIRALRGAVVLAEARGARPVRLPGPDRREPRARVAGVAAGRRAVAARVRARVGVRHRRVWS